MGSNPSFGVDSAIRRAMVRAQAISIHLIQQLKLFSRFKGRDGLSLENARLLEETQSRAREQEAINIMANAVSQSLDRDELLKIALGKVLEVTRRERVSIRLKDPTTDQVMLVAHRGFSQEEIDDLRQRTRHQATEQVLASGQPLVVDNRQVLPNTQSLLPQSFSVAWIPIKAGARVVGVLGISAGRPVPFSQREVEFLQAIGNVIGVAIENAQLFGQTKRNLEQIRVLNEIGIALTSTLDLHDLLKIFLEKIDHALPYSASSVRLYNRESGLLEPVACRNLDVNEWQAAPWRGGRGIPNIVFENKAPLIVRNLQSDPRIRDPQFFRKHELVSYLGAPLIVRDEVLGVLSFYTKEERAFSNEEVEFLSTLAGHAAIGIHNSQLYEQTTKQAVELKRAYKELKSKEEIQTLLKDLNQDITRLDIDTLLKKLTEKVREVLRVDISDVRTLVEGEWKLTGITGIDPSLLTSGRSGTGRGPAGWIQQHRQPLVIPDLSRTDLPTGTTMKNLGLRGYVGVPLFSRGGEVIGVLRALSYQARDFTQEEVELLQLLASGSGVALENAKLLDEIKRQAVALENSNEAKDELLEVMARQKEELSRLNSGLQSEIAERGRARAELAAKNRDLETLLYVTSHDLREPLRAIENFSRMVNDRYKDRLDEKGQDFLRRVVLGSQRLTHLLDDILVLSRSQRMGAPTEKVEGESIVTEALRRLEGKISATNAQVRVAKNFHGLRVDKTWATQAVYNLIANALKFTHNGEAPDVEIAPYQPEGSASKVVGIAVRDRGPGVALEHAERIFQLFQRAVGREVEGTGAGLAIVRQIAERHGGDAWVEPRQGGGSEFIITFGRSEDLEGDKINGHSTHGDSPSGG